MCIRNNVNLVLFLLLLMFYIFSIYGKRSDCIPEISKRGIVDGISIRRYTDEQLSILHETQIKSRINEDYLQRYHGIHRGNVDSLLPSNIKLHNASRVLSYERFFIMKDFQSWIQKYNIQCKRFASINGPDPEDQYITCSEGKIYYNYKEGATGMDEKNADLYLLSLPDGKKIDFWHVQQILEHIYNGHLVLRRLYDNTVCGGHLFVSVPIYNIPHMVPLHFYSYTPMGIVTMFFETGWKVIDLGLWGNREYLIELLKKKSWPTLFDALAQQEKANHTRDFFFNDPFFGFQVWLLGRKNCSP